MEAQTETNPAADAAVQADAPPKQGDAIDIGIDAQDRDDISQAMSRMLADSFTLYLRTHGFHWNVEGPMFNTLHVMFMEQYTELWNALDEIAERIRALGFYAPGTAQHMAKFASIQEIDDQPDAMKMVQLLVQGNEACARTAREVLKTADDGGDEPTVDLMTQRLQVHEKNAWMLRSLLK